VVTSRKARVPSASALSKLDYDSYYRVLLIAIFKDTTFVYMKFTGPDCFQQTGFRRLRSFKRLQPGLHLRLRPEDSEGNVRGRLKNQLVADYQKRRMGVFEGDQLNEMLRQISLYRAVVPDSFDGPLVSFSELRDAITALPGKAPALAQREGVQTLVSSRVR